MVKVVNSVQLGAKLVNSVQLVKAAHLVDRPPLAGILRTSVLTLSLHKAVDISGARPSEYSKIFVLKSILKEVG